MSFSNKKNKKKTVVQKRTFKWQKSGTENNSISTHTYLHIYIYIYEDRMVQKRRKVADGFFIVLQPCEYLSALRAPNSDARCSICWLSCASLGAALPNTMRRNNQYFTLSAAPREQHAGRQSEKAVAICNAG